MLSYENIPIEINKINTDYQFQLHDANIEEIFKALNNQNLTRKTILKSTIAYKI